MRKCFWILFVAVGVAATPVQLAAQDPNPPNAVEKIIAVVNDVKLGLQVHGGVRAIQQEALPLNRRSVTYLQRPVAGTLTYSVLQYGAGLALRFRGAEVAVAYRHGGEVGSHWLQFRDGTDAIPLTPSYGRATLRAEYFVFDWVGVGVAVHRSGSTLSCSSSCNFRVNGVEVREDLFEARSSRATYSVYVPVRRRWGPVRLFGRVGASLLGRSQFETYRSDFARYQNPEQPGEPTDASAPTFGVASSESPKPEVYRQFGRAGVGVPLGDMVTVRAFVGVERLSVSDLTKTWAYDVRLEVGLPF